VAVAVRRRDDLSVPSGRGIGVGLHYDPEAFGRFSETLARTLGTARYLVAQTAIVAIWILVNVTAAVLRFDPYPFILLNLAFSTQAAYAAPLILLAQNRQDARDRAQTERDREIAARTQADAEYLAREVASIRLALAELPTHVDLAEAIDRLNATLDAVRRDGPGSSGPAPSPSE
jgi:uncharacterized membrane protein